MLTEDILKSVISTAEKLEVRLKDYDRNATNAKDVSDAIISDYYLPQDESVMGMRLWNSWREDDFEYQKDIFPQTLVRMKFDAKNREQALDAVKQSIEDCKRTLRTNEERKALVKNCFEWLTAMFNSQYLSATTDIFNILSPAIIGERVYNHVFTEESESWKKDSRKWGKELDLRVFSKLMDMGIHHIHPFLAQFRDNHTAITENYFCQRPLIAGEPNKNAYDLLWRTVTIMLKSSQYSGEDSLNALSTIFSGLSETATFLAKELKKPEAPQIDFVDYFEDSEYHIKRTTREKKLTGKKRKANFDDYIENYIPYRCRNPPPLEPTVTTPVDSDDEDVTPMKADMTLSDVINDNQPTKSSNGRTILRSIKSSAGGVTNGRSYLPGIFKSKKNSNKKKE